MSSSSLALKSFFSTKIPATADKQQQRQLLVQSYQSYSIATTRRFAKAKNAATAEQTFKALDLDVRTHFFTLDNVTSAKSEEVKDRVLKIVKWKLSREQFRPTLYAQASSNSAKVIQESLIKAINDLEEDLRDFDFSSSSSISGEGEDDDITSQNAIKLSDIQYKAVEALSSKLSGIGPATATAILSQVEIKGNNNTPNNKLINLQGICPFMSDAALAMVAGDGGKIEYTKKSCKNLFVAVNRKWLELYGGIASSLSTDVEESSGMRRDRGSNHQHNGEDSYYKMSPAQISHCMWVEAMLK